MRKDLFPVGRLDKDTEGLLLITNDGNFAHEITSPKKHMTKIYEAVLERPVKEEDLAAFENGIELEDGTKCLPAKIEKTDNDNKVLVYIHEGKYHQVKRMFGACSNRVNGLKRIQIGEWRLDDLKTGEVRKISNKIV
jgi:16S rRNA pseudouridine516 synthase